MSFDPQTDIKLQQREFLLTEMTKPAEDGLKSVRSHSSLGGTQERF